MNGDDLLDQALHDPSEHIGDDGDLASCDFAEGSRRAVAIGREWARADRRRRQVEAMHADERDRLDRWRDDNVRVATDRMAWYEAQLTGWHRHLIETDQAGKTLPLPHVTLRARQHAARFEILDPGAALAWAQESAPELTRTKVEIDRQAMSKRLHTTDTGQVIDPQTGEVVPGCGALAAELRITVSAVEP